jgi:hypothetical protein
MTSETDAAPERAAPIAALSIDEAAGLLAAEPSPPEEREEEAPASGPASDEGEEQTPETEAIEDERPAEATAPESWSAKDKAWFDCQPPEVRERIAAYDATREAAAAKARNEAARAREAADAEARTLADARGEVERLLGEAAQRHAGSNWQGVDWARWAELDPAAALQGRIRFEQEQAELQRLTAASRTAHDQAFRSYVADEGKKLAELAPDLASDDGKRAEVGRWLIDQGYSPETLRGVSARDLVTARKAMLWDRAEAALKSPKPAPTRQGSRPVRASAAPAPSTPARKAQEAHNRFAQTRTLDDAIAVLNARR